MGNRRPEKHLSGRYRCALAGEFSKWDKEYGKIEAGRTTPKNLCKKKPASFQRSRGSKNGGAKSRRFRGKVK